MPSTAAVELNQVGKVYRRGLLRPQCVHALHEVSLRIEPGEVFGLVGPNRAGKTTLLKILLSLCSPTTGHVRRFGAPADRLATLTRVGYMHENQAFPSYLTATGLLEYYGRLSLIPRHALGQRISALLREVGLAGRQREPISQFSKGMSQRLALAQALINEPDLLVLDEPAEGLDELGRQLLLEKISIQKQGGKAALLVSHSLADVQRSCDRIGVLVEGRLLYVGSCLELAKDPSTGEIRTLDAALLPFYEGRTP